MPHADDDCDVAADNRREAVDLADLTQISVDRRTTDCGRRPRPACAWNLQPLEVPKAVLTRHLGVGQAVSDIKGQ